MFGKSIRGRTPEPSFYYVMLAASCFRRTARGRRPKFDEALRNIGQEYLAKAGCGAAHEQISEFSLARIRRTGAKTSRRQPWTVA